MRVHFYRRITSDGTVLLFLLFLIMSISFFVILHLLYNYATLLDGYDGIFDSHRLSISAERGVAEFFNYFQCLLLVGLLYLIYRESGQIIYLILSVIYFIIFLDDSFAIHETLGLLFSGADNQATETGVRLQDYGEVLVFALAGAPVLAVLVYGLKKTSPQHLPLAALFGVCLVALAAFAVLADFFGRMVMDDPVMLRVAEIIEDGGEMLAIALACALALLIYRSHNFTNLPAPTSAMPERQYLGSK